MPFAAIFAVTRSNPGTATISYNANAEPAPWTAVTNIYAAASKRRGAIRISPSVYQIASQQKNRSQKITAQLIACTFNCAVIII